MTRDQELVEQETVLRLQQQLERRRAVRARARPAAAHQTAEAVTPLPEEILPQLHASTTAEPIPLGPPAPGSREWQSWAELQTVRRLQARIRKAPPLPPELVVHRTEEDTTIRLDDLVPAGR